MHDDLHRIATVATDLTGTQIVALEALMGGMTVTAAAEHAGVNRSTLYRWLIEPGFAAELSRAKRARIAGIHAGLSVVADAAVDVLGDALRDDRVSVLNRSMLALKVLKAAGVDEPQAGEPCPKDGPNHSAGG